MWAASACQCRREQVHRSIRPGGSGRGSITNDATGHSELRRETLADANLLQPDGADLEGRERAVLRGDLYNHQGIVQGWLEFCRQFAPSGQVTWVRPGTNAIALLSYPAGFTNEVNNVVPRRIWLRRAGRTRR